MKYLDKPLSSRVWFLLFLVALVSYLPSLAWYLIDSGEVLQYYASTTILYACCFFATLFFLRWWSTSGEQTQAFFRRRLLWLAIILLLFGLLEIVLIFNPYRYYLSSDVYFYSQFVLWMRQGYIPYLNFYFPYPPAMAVLFYLFGFAGITSSIKIQGFFSVISIMNIILVYLVINEKSKRLAMPGALFFAILPLNLIEIAGNGHNDAIVVTAVLLALLFLFKKKYFLSSFVFIISFYLKPFSFFLLPFIVFYIIRETNFAEAFLKLKKVTNKLGKVKLFWETPTGSFAIPWFALVVFPLLIASIFFPDLILSAIFSQLIRSNTNGTLAYLAIIDQQFTSINVVSFCFIAFLAVYLWRTFKQIHHLPISPLEKKKLYWINILPVLPFISTLVSFLASWVAFALFVILVLATVLVHDPRLKAEIVAATIRAMAFFIILTGIAWILEPILVNNFPLFPYMNTVPIIYILNIQAYRIPIVQIVAGSIITGIGVMLLEHARFFLRNDSWRSNPKRFAFECVVASGLFVLSSGVFYSWYILCFIPLFFFESGIKLKRFKISVILFMIAYCFNYPAINFVRYDPPRVTLFTSNFDNNSKWTFNTNVTAPDTFQFKLDQKFELDLNVTNAIDRSTSYFQINKSFSPIPWVQGLRLMLSFGNCTYEVFNLTISFDMILLNGTSTTANVTDLSSTYFWTNNPIQSLIFIIPQYYKIHSNILEGAQAINGVRLTFRYIQEYRFNFGRVNDRYKIVLYDISIYQVNSFLY